MWVYNNIYILICQVRSAIEECWGGAASLTALESRVWFMGEVGCEIVESTPLCGYFDRGMLWVLGLLGCMR